MKTLLIFMLTVSTITHAQEPLPADAPIMLQPNPGYVCIPTDQRLNEGKAAKRCVENTATLKKDNVIMPVAAFTGIVVGSVIVTAIVAGLIVGFAKK